MGNLKLKKKRDLSAFRRIAIGTWRTVGDPSVYGSMRLEVDRALEYLEAFRSRTGRHLTLTHMMAKATADTLEKMPDANAILRFNRIYLREDIGIFFQVAIKDPESGELDLSGTTIPEANTKNLLQIVDEFKSRVENVRSGEDKELEGTRTTFKKIPFLMLNFVLSMISLLSYTFNLNLKWAGVPKDPFGSCMITNIGALGLEEAYVPLVPYSRVPLLIAMGEVKEEPVAKAGELRVAKTMKLFATFDHRVLDGQHAAIMAKTLKRYFEDPESHFGNIDEMLINQNEEKSQLEAKAA